MKEETKRDKRRKENKRIEKKVKEYLKKEMGYLSLELVEELAKKLRDNPASCSCGMCGNPRKHQKKKLTKAEELNKIDFKEQINETI